LLICGECYDDGEGKVLCLVKHTHIHCLPCLFNSAFSKEVKS
jgi:hypothetical protein